MSLLDIVRSYCVNLDDRIWSRSLRLSRSSKREREMQKIKKQKKRKGRMRPPGEKLKDKVRKRRPENKEADKRRHETAEAKRLQRERQKTAEYRAGAATRLARSRITAAKKAAERHAPEDEPPRTRATAVSERKVTIHEEVLQPVANRGGGRGGFRRMKRKKIQNLCGNLVYAEEGEIADDAKPL